jgi:hypothetical protein
MKKAATTAIEIRRTYPGWRSVTWLVLLAFTLQSFVTQTHIHALPPMAAATIGKVLTSAPGADKSPVSSDTTTCPFCQAISHAGAFFASSTPRLPFPIDWAECLVPFLIAIAGRSFAAHSWQSRAPPQH